MIEFRLLGSVEAWHAGRCLDLGTPKQRLVLAVLLADAGVTVSVDALVDRLWDGETPAQARKVVHAHLSRIRGLLRPADGSALVRRAGGYAIEADPRSIDSHLVRMKLDEAAQAYHDDGRVVRLREAVALWRGEPLTGVPGRWAEQIRHGWRQLHVDTVVWWARTELSLGNSARLLVPLTDLAGRYPLAEPLVAVLMRALHAAGQSAVALDCYTAVRHRLAEELGADPSQELQRVHQEILRTSTPTPTGQTVRGGAPALLPMDVHGFSGREGELRRLDSLVDSASVGAIVGTAGVGKTALAVHWAHRVAKRFPDGQLYVNLRGFDPSGAAMDPSEAIRRFLDALDVPAERVPADIGARADLYRTLVAGKKMLIVLDNARDSEQVLSLLPGAPGCFVLVTSRHRLTGLVAAVGAHPVPLDLLSFDEARDLLTRRLGRGRIAGEPAAVDELISRCVRLPLALAVVAANAAIQPGLPLGVLADQLRGTHDRLDALSTGDAPATDLRAVFSWSYRTLGEVPARIFRLLGLHPGPEFAAAAAASLAAIPVEQIRPLLRELVAAHLVTEPVPGRFGLHDLLCAYSMQLGEATDPAPQRVDALRRLLDHYLHATHTAARLLEPQREPLVLGPAASGVATVALSTFGQAQAWLVAEHGAVIHLIGLAADRGFARHAWQLAWALTTFLQRRGDWRAQKRTLTVALRSARQQDDVLGQAHTHLGLARAHLRTGRSGDALDNLLQALGLFTACGHDLGQARVHGALGVIHGSQGSHGLALQHLQLAHDLFRAGGRPQVAAQILNDVGWNHALAGDYPRALTACREALTVLEQSDDAHGQASTWDSLGYAYHHLGLPERAIDCYTHALELFRKVGERFLEAETLIHLGDSHHARDDVDSARLVLRQALTILDELGHPAAETLRARLLGTAAF